MRTNNKEGLQLLLEEARRALDQIVGAINIGLTRVNLLMGAALALAGLVAPHLKGPHWIPVALVLVNIVSIVLAAVAYNIAKIPVFPDPKLIGRPIPPEKLPAVLLAGLRNAGMRGQEVVGKLNLVVTIMTLLLFCSAALVVVAVIKGGV